MLRGAFSFQGRIGRLHFFLQNLTMVAAGLPRDIQAGFGRRGLR